MLTFIDENGNQHAAMAEVKETKAVNGEKSLKGTIYTNENILEGIGRGWKIHFNDENYYLTYVNPIDEGNRVVVEFDAIHEFFYKMLKSVVHSELNGSHTMQNYLDFIFNGSGFVCRLEANTAAFTKESFGYKNRLALFNDLIQGTGLEFSINGNIVRVLKKVGTDLSTIVKKGFNLNELKIEKDLQSFITYQKGYGAFIDEEDHSKGRLVVEYKSPLANQYGIIEGDPIMDERFTIAANLLARVKDSVDNSYGISVSIDMEDLTEAGYEYDQPHEGDYIMAINDDLRFRQKIRIMSYTTEYDTAGNILNHEVSCGSDNLITNVAKSESANQRKIWDGINDAQNSANLAWISADGKNHIYWGEDEPTGPHNVGDTWYQKVGEETVMKFWNGYEWVLFFDPIANKRLIDNAMKEAETAKADAKTAYEDAVKKSEEQVAANNADWDRKMDSVKNDFNTQFVDQNEKITETREKAQVAFDKTADLAKVVQDPKTGLVTTVNQLSLGFQVTSEDLSALKNAIPSGIDPTKSIHGAWEQGDINTSNGLPIASANYCRMVDYASVTPGEQLITATSKGDLVSCYFQWYDKDKKFVSYTYGSKGVVPANASYLRASTGGLVKTIDCMIFKDAIPDVGYTLKSQLTVLNNQIDLKVEKGQVLAQLNLSPTGVYIKGDLIRLDGNVSMDDAWVNKLYADTAFISNLNAKTLNAVSANINSIIAKNLNADVITSKHLSVDTGLIDKLFSTSAYIERLTSKTAFINTINAMDIDANRIKTGTLNAGNIRVINLDASTITSGYLSANRIAARSITADKLTADAIQVGINSLGSTIKISSTALAFFNGSSKIAQLTSQGMEFWNGSTYIGRLGVSGHANNSSLRGLITQLEYYGDFVTWTYNYNSSGTAHYTVMTLDPKGRVYAGQGGVHIDTSVWMKANQRLRVDYISDVDARAEWRIKYGTLGGNPGLFLGNDNGGIFISNYGNVSIGYGAGNWYDWAAWVVNRQ